MAKLLEITVLILCSYSFSVTLGARIPNNGTDPRIQLVDLNFDCLQTICSFLNGSDLLSVSLANTRLTEAANYAFRHYGGKFVHITDRYKNDIIMSLKPDPEDNEMRLSIAKSKRVFLNSTEVRSMMPIVCEGIKEMIIDFHGLKEPQKLLDSIADFCSNTLITMKWEHIGYTSPKLTRSFPNLENLVIEYSSLDENLDHFNEWFPAMKSLRLYAYTNRRLNGKLLRKRFPNLISLAVDIDEYRGFSYSDFQSLLQQNRQIRSLNIVRCSVRDRNKNLFEFINETLPELEELIWRKTVYDLAQSHTSLNLKNLRKFDGYFGNFDDWETSFILEHSLQYLSMQVKPITPNVVDFIKNNTELITLKLSNEVGLREHLEIADIISSLPKLTELYLYGYSLTAPPDLTKLLTDFDSLNKVQFGFYYDLYGASDQWSKYVGPGHWKCSTESTWNGFVSTTTCERQ